MEAYQTTQGPAAKQLAPSRTLRMGTGVERSLATCRGCTRKCACLSVLGLCLLSSTLKFCAQQMIQGSG